MSLPAAVQDNVNRIREVVTMMRGHLHAAHFVGMPDESRNEITAALMRLAMISAECNAISGSLGAARATGQLDLRLMMASLHRAGDHTLDPDEKNPTGGQ